MKQFQVTCTVQESKLYDALVMLESFASEIVSVPIKSESKALVRVEHNADGRGRTPGVRIKAMMAFIETHPKFTREEINMHLAKKGITRADPVLMQLIDKGAIKRTGVGTYEVSNG